ncbi:MAG TPA: DUF397 domain-containing protein [Streptosporangiaceae bacterium]|jgi:hypothetical protein
MTSSDHSRPAWRTSTHSGQNGNCIEVATHGPAIAVRDSKNPAGHQLAFPAPAWRTFTCRIQAAGLAPAATRPSTHGQQAPSLWGALSPPARVPVNRPALTGTPDRADLA